MNIKSKYKNYPVKVMAFGALSGLLLTAGAQFLFAHTSAAAQPPASAASAKTVSISAGLQSAVKVTTKAFNEKTANYNATLQIPVIAGLLDKQYQAELNDMISRHAMEDFTVIKKQANDEAASLKKNPDAGYEFHPYEVIVQYELKSDGSRGVNGILSLKILTYVYTGGAHGSTRVDTYNVRNKTAAARITLKDLYGNDYRKIVNAKISAAIAKDPESYFQDSFKTISDGQSFYVQDGRAVIVFQQYEIAPYAAGIPEFNIALPGHKSNAPGNLSSLNVIVNGKTLQSSALYANEEGIAMAPLRSIASALGYKLNYSAPAHQVELSKGGTTLYVQINRDIYWTDIMPEFTLGAAPALKNNQVYVPVSFFTKVLKAKAAYSTDALTITSASK
ncbi:PdaC/SigV domain-containing protein [Paenibacillus solisilvae]|uniref:PdaC/SigV domain-containing protein n=1 Tax=Paenibacillus solisilvae TaxID=2486751 RepID=A0ABW0VSQ0_9BACL